MPEPGLIPVDHDPFAAARPVRRLPVDHNPFVNRAAKRDFGETGLERWWRKGIFPNIARGVVNSAVSGFTLPRDVLTGAQSADLSDPEYVGRVLDMAGMAGGAGFASATRRGGTSLGMAGGKVAREAPDLPMDEASRMARAREMGFRTGMPLYHGTDQDIMAFAAAPEGIAPTTGATPGLSRAVSVALEPETANEFASLAAKARSGDPQVYPLLHRAKKPGVIDLDGTEKHLEIMATVENAFDDGYDAILFRNYTTPAGETGRNILMVADPSQLRSPHAAFDPAKKDSTNILAANDPKAMAKLQAAKEGIRAYHGSPHDFDRFSLEHIGKGEGAQAYGSGLYFAENEGVARSYRDALAQPTFRRRIADDIARHMADGLDENAARKAVAKAYLERAETYERLGNPNAADWRARADLATSAPMADLNDFKGHMYEVNIKADPEDFLDWDKPLSEQPRAVQEAYARARGTTIEGLEAGGLDMMGRSGEALYTDVGLMGKGDIYQAASERLRGEGVPGVRYLDQGSRDPVKMKELADDLAQYREAAKHWIDVGDVEKQKIAEKQIEVLERRLKQTSNYVVFDDSIIEIVRKYGIAGLALLGPEMEAEVRSHLVPVDHDPFEAQ